MHHESEKIMSNLQIYLTTLAIVLVYSAVAGLCAFARRKPEAEMSVQDSVAPLSPVRWTSPQDWIAAVRDQQQMAMAWGDATWIDLVGGVVALGDTGYEICPNADPENIDSRFVLTTPEGGDFFACEDINELKRVAEAMADQRRQANELFLDTDIGS